jgi:hypothetical protein
MSAAARLAALLSIGIIAAIGASCGGERACKQDTLYVVVTLGGAADGADSVEATISNVPADGGGTAAPRTARFSWPRGSASATLEVAFPEGYPGAGTTVSLRLTAYRGPQRLVSRVSDVALDAGCTRAAIDIGGSGDGGAASDCDPALDNRCSDDGRSLLACTMPGMPLVVTPCPSGCTALSGPARCQHLSPTGAAERGDGANATLPVVLAADTTFNTETGEITGGFTRAAGPGVVGGVWYRLASQPGSTVRLGVFGVQGLTVNDSVTVRIAGKHPLVIVSSGDVTLGGTLLATDCAAATPTGGMQAGGVFDVDNGNGLGSRGGRAGGSGMTTTSGGGGGGHGDAGGAGGAGVGVAGGAGGAIFGDLTTEPVTLIGGSGGGAGGGGAVGGKGGAGGGAIQIAADGAMTVRGTIQAGGCGGAPGGNAGGGGGGGSGGVILLEAPTITFAAGAVLAANGGGGGGGDRGMPGQAGPASTATATGGSGANLGTRGGNGGTAGQLAGRAGTNVSSTLRHGGGGGGAAGRIAIKTLNGMITDQGAVFSPAGADRAASGQPAVTVGRAAFE